MRDDGRPVALRKQAKPDDAARGRATRTAILHNAAPPVLAWRGNPIQLISHPDHPVALFGQTRRRLNPSLWAGRLAPGRSLPSRLVTSRSGANGCRRSHRPQRASLDVRPNTDEEVPADSVEALGD